VKEETNSSNIECSSEKDYVTELTDPKELSNVHNYSDRQIRKIAQLNKYYST
jgi:hypothetical protein